MGNRPPPVIQPFGLDPLQDWIQRRFTVRESNLRYDPAFLPVYMRRGQMTKDEERGIVEEIRREGDGDIRTPEARRVMIKRQPVIPATPVLPKKEVIRHAVQNQGNVNPEAERGQVEDGSTLHI